MKMRRIEHCISPRKRGGLHTAIWGCLVAHLCLSSIPESRIVQERKSTGADTNGRQRNDDRLSRDFALPRASGRRSRPHTSDPRPARGYRSVWIADRTVSGKAIQEHLEDY